MRKIDQLTAARVKHLTKPGRYGDGAGLYLEISKGGGKSWVFKSWVFMWKRDRKRRAMGLASAHIISLVKARDLAKKAAEVVADASSLPPVYLAIIFSDLTSALYLT